MSVPRPTYNVTQQRCPRAQSPRPAVPSRLPAQTPIQQHVVGILAEKHRIQMNIYGNRRVVEELWVRCWHWWLVCVENGEKGRLGRHGTSGQQHIW